MPITDSPFIYYGNEADGRPYSIAFVVISSIFIVPLLILWLHGLRSMERKRDKARGAIPWIKILFGLWLSCLLFTTIWGGMTLHQTLKDKLYYYGRLDTSARGQATMRIVPLANWLGQLASITLSITFIELGVGFLHYVSNTALPSRTRTYLRYSAWTWGIILAFMSLAWLGFSQFILTHMFEAMRDGWGSGRVLEDDVEAKVEHLRRGRRTMGRYELMLDLVLVFVAVKGLVLALVVVFRTGGQRLLQNSAALFLVATILNTIRQTYATVMHIVYVLPTWPNSVPSLVHTLVIAPVVDYVEMFVILVLLYVIAIRKEGGLWSGESTVLSAVEMSPPPPYDSIERTPTMTHDHNTYMAASRDYRQEETTRGMEDDMRKMSISPVGYRGVGGRSEMGV